jgi:hypothetical protein
MNRHMPATMAAAATPREASMMAEAYIESRSMAWLDRGVQPMDGNLTRRTVLGSVGAAAMFPQWAGAVHSHAAQVPQALLEISLRIDEPRAGLHGWRRAPVRGGVASGKLLRGSVQQGQLQWLVDPASGAVQVALDLQLLRVDGALIRLRDRSADAEVAPLEFPGVPTAPELFDAGGIALPVPARLAGRLDASCLGRGVVWLRAFNQG